MTQKVLTLIIPAYNMEAYLPQCLDSVMLAAASAASALDVIVVNDGSADRTASIAESYADANPGVVRLVSKPNGNYGSCINAALPLAKGKYVKVLDADDSVYAPGLATLCRFLPGTDADMVLTDFDIIDPAGTITAHRDFSCGLTAEPADASEVVTRPEFLDMQMHAVTYRTSMLTRMAYTQSEGISYTDQQWIFMPVAQVRTVAYCHATVYRYLVGRAGQTMDPAVRMRSIGHMMKCTLKMARDYDDACHSLDDPRRRYLRTRLRRNIRDIYITALTSRSRDLMRMLRRYDNDLRACAPESYRTVANKYISLWRRAPVTAPVIGFTLRMLLGK